ncbi:hypothetical protein J3458_020299 [Metarhizium acridum]|uniref:uncharacterized protein n=1 Tax=Metarhizium acridum TaxID=92637 RepID=UPI001C6AE560|nr:hypothetical protein J3458_020299 [Metarhizium acridum]
MMYVQQVAREVSNALLDTHVEGRQRYLTPTEFTLFSVLQAASAPDCASGPWGQAPQTRTVLAGGAFCITAVKMVFPSVIATSWEKTRKATARHRHLNARVVGGRQITPNWHRERERERRGVTDMTAHDGQVFKLKR